MTVLSQHRHSRSVWLGPAAADAEEEAQRRPHPSHPVAAALRTAGRIPGAGCRVAAPVSTWPNVQNALPGSKTVSRRAGPELIPRTTRLEHATSHGAVVMAHEPLSVVGSGEPAQERPCSGSMRAMHRMIEHLEARKAVLTKLFREYDKDGSGSIDRDELNAALRGLGLRLSREELDGVMAHLDTDGGGDIDLEEFLSNFRELRAERGFAARLSQPKETAAPEAQSLRKDRGSHRPSSTSRKAVARMIEHLIERKTVLTKMFREFDTDNSGTIDMEELDSALINLGLRLNGEELQGVMDYLDTDGGGDIDLEEFIEHFKIERAQRLDGHIPELKDARLQLRTRLQQGKHVTTNADGTSSCSATPGAHHRLYRVLTTIERLQSLDRLSPEHRAELRSYIQELMQRGICDTTSEELEFLQHMYRMYAPHHPKPVLRNGLGAKGPRYGEEFTSKRLNTAEWRQKKRQNFSATIPSSKVVPNHRLPTPLNPNDVDCTQLRTMGVPKRRSCAPPAARKPVFPPKPARLDALRSAVRMGAYPADPFQPSHIVPVHSPRHLPRQAHSLKPVSERTRTPKQKITARPPEKPKTARLAMDTRASKPKVPSPPASKPGSPIAGWLSSRLADELADKERERMRSVITDARYPPAGPRD